MSDKASACDPRVVIVMARVVIAVGGLLLWAALDGTKTTASARTILLPAFAVTALSARRGRPYLGEFPMIFPSTAGTWRDPNNFGKQ